MTGKFTTGLVGSLFDLVRGGGKNLTPDVAASLAIARQAMSNVPEITDDREFGEHVRVATDGKSMKTQLHILDGDDIGRGPVIGKVLN